MSGHEFRREYPIPPYTADFCCVPLKLIVEVDGEHHHSDQGRRYDQRRDHRLSSPGYTVLRIPGYHIENDLSAVLELIEQTIDRCLSDPGESRSKPLTPSPPSPSPRTGRGERCCCDCHPLKSPKNPLWERCKTHDHPRHSNRRPVLATNTSSSVGRPTVIDDTWSPNRCINCPTSSPPSVTSRRRPPSTVAGVT